MRFKLIIDKTGDEEVTATVHERSAVTDQIELLVMGTPGQTGSLPTPKTT